MSESKPLSVLIVDRDPMRRHALRELLQEHESVRVEAEAESPESGYLLVNQLKPAIVILELDNPPDPGLGVIERCLITSPQSAIFVTADGERADTILRTVRAGAREFLVRPVNKKDLIAAIQRVAQQRALARGDAPSGGKVITVFGAKGGRGATLIALNLATALGKRSGGTTVAVDLDLQAGDLSLFLNLNPPYTVYDAMANGDRLDAIFLKSLLIPHPSGFSLLAAPHRIEEADRIQPLRITHLLALLKASLSFVVVDTAPAFDERLLAALDASDELLLVTAPDVSSLYHTQRCLELLDRMGYALSKVKLALNRCPQPGGTAVKMAQEVLKHPIFCELPEDRSAEASVLAGEPLVANARTSPLGARLTELAAKFDRRKLSKAEHSPSARGGWLSLLRSGPARVTKADLYAAE